MSVRKASVSELLFSTLVGHTLPMVRPSEIFPNGQFLGFGLYFPDYSLYFLSSALHNVGLFAAVSDCSSALTSGSRIAFTFNGFFSFKWTQ